MSFMIRSNRLWRVGFVLGGLLVVVGGPMHPDGEMAQMLADPLWPPSHGLMTVGFFLMAAGWWRVRTRIAPADRRWATVAFAATLVQAIDYIAHTFAFVDAEALVAGAPTPVFDLHMLVTPILNPIYGVLMIAVILGLQRRSGPGSIWYGWVGVVGALGHAVANLFVAGLGMEQLRFLFPFIVFLALWHVVAGLAPLVERPEIT